jgi:hypothetical protein
MRLWIMIFSAALFAGGTCLGVALRPRLADKSAPRAATRPVRESSSELSVDRFASKLGLSEDQDHELDMILEETHRDLEAHNRAIRMTNDRSRERVMALLSEEQKQKLDGLMTEERRRRSEADVERTVRAYTKFLTLSDEEAQGFRKALLEARERRREYYRQRKGAGEHDKAHPDLKALKDRQNAEIAKALSPDHFQRYVEVQELVER